MKAKGKVAAAGFSVMLGASCLAGPMAAWAADDPHVPTATTTTTGNYIKGAASRAAMPSVEILGLASVEESGQFIDTANYYNWDQPKYMLAATAYNTAVSPFLANLATDTGTSANPSAILNTARAGGGAGPNASLGAADATDAQVLALNPDVIVGTGGGTAGYTGTGVDYGFTDYTGLVGTMDAIAAAADAADAADSTRSLRYGEQSAGAIAQSYEEYVLGTMGMVQQALDQDLVAKRTVALVQNVVSGEDEDGNTVMLYDLMTTDEAGGDGTASTNRYLETTSNAGLKGISMATNFADTTELATADDLAGVGLVMVGGQQSSANYAAIMAQLEADGLLGKTYFVNNNGSAGAMYGVVMNSVENAQNVGRILGCLYPEVVSQQSWMAYYYQTFYHIASGDLADVMNNALHGVRCWNVASPATASDAYEWDVATAYATGDSQATISDELAIGYTYYQSLQA